MKNDIPLISIGFDGYELEDTLKGLAKTNSKNIVLCAIDGFTKHVIPEEMDMSDWEKTKLLFNKYNLNFYGLAGHCNISDDSDMEKMEKRMRYTGFMGGKYIDTNAGHKGTEENFYKNAKEIIDLAEELDIVVCLETHGDMVESGASGQKLLEKIKSPRIRIGYDPANVYFYSRGIIDPIEDLKYALDYTGIIHFKGVSHNESESKWFFPDMQSSIFDYDKFFNILENYNYNKMIAIEVEGMLKFEEGKGFSEDPAWPQEKIIGAYNTEIEYLSNKLFWM